MTTQNREKLNLSPSDARLLIWGDLEGFKIIDKEVIGKSRWSVHYRIVVQRESDGKYFSDEYQIGATESQDEQPYEYTEPDFTEVFPVEKKVIIYE